MRKYFYLLEFKYIVNDNYESRFDLGIFSKKINAYKKIEKVFNKPGFNEYSKENFRIIKFGVNFDDTNIDKENTILYCVSHEYEKDNDEFTYWNIFDYFSSKDKAMAHISHLKKHSRIGKKYPDNFEIIEIKVNNDNCWSEGFTKIHN